MSNLEKISNKFLEMRLDSGNPVIRNEAANELIKRNYDDFYKELFGSFYPNLKLIGGDEKNHIEEIKDEGYYRKPSMEFKMSHDVVIKISRKKDYDDIMQILECYGFTGPDESNPTDYNIFQYNCSPCIKINNTEKVFFWGNSEFYENRNEFISTVKNFYETNNLHEDRIKRINAWFETYKPNRASKVDLK